MGFKPVSFFQIQTQTGWGRNLAVFAEWCAPQPGWCTLDVGCGPGLLPALLRQQGCRAFGVDLNPQMFQPAPLHPTVAVSDVLALPFASASFDLITASNLLFLLPDPQAALAEMVRVLRLEGQIALLNPSEHLSLAAAAELAEARGLQGLARESLLDWAARAEANRRWTEAELAEQFSARGLQLTETSLKIGPGFPRCPRGKRLHFTKE